MSMREWCIALLAGAVAGGGGTIAVQQTRPAVERKAAKPAPKTARPAAKTSAALPARAPVIFDCPMPSAALSPAGIGAIASTSFPATAGFPPLSGGLWDGGGVFLPLPTPPPSVPEPAQWALLVTGFGLIGLALRRSVSREGGR